MRRWLIGFVVCVCWASQAQAQTNIVTFETVTFGASSTGLTATTIRPTGQGFVTICNGKVETAQIRYRYDGVAPTASIGVLGDIGDVITINGLANIDLFRGIKTGSSSGVINFSCARDGIVNTTGSGSGGAGGGAGTSNTTETTQLAVLAAVDGLEGFTDGLEASSTLIASAIFAEDVTAVGGDKGIQTLCVRRATAPADMSSGATAGDYEPCQVDANGRVYGNSSIYTPAGDSAMDDTNDAVKVVSATAANMLVTTTSDDQQAEDNSIAYALTLPTVVSLNYCDSGSAFVRCPIGTGGAGSIDSSTSRVTIADNDPVNDASVKFDAQMVADSAASAGNPLYIGGLATNSIVGDTPAADGNRIGFVGGLDRVQITRPHSDLEDVVKATVGVTDGSSTQLVAAQGSGVRFCATTLVISNSSATNVTLDIRDGTAGSVILTAPAAANMGGAVVPLSSPLCTTANTIMAMDPSAAASTVTVTALGFKTEM